MPTACIVTQFYSPEKVGTAFYTHDLARAIHATEGWDVRVVTGEPYYPEFAKYDRFEKQRIRHELIDEVTVERVRTYVPSGGRALGRILSEVNFLVQIIAALLLRRIQRHEYVISFSPGPLSVVAGWLLTSRSGRHLTIVHDVSSGLARSTGLVSAPGVTNLMEKFEAWALSRPDVVSVLSRQMREEILGMGVQTRIDEVALWVRDELFQLEQPVAPLPETPTVLYSGNLGRKQGLDRIIGLATALQERMPRARIAIRGSGPLRETLTQGVERRNLRNVRFEPLVPESQLCDALEDAWVHLAPQDPGGAPFSVPSKVLNALAVGRPVIVTADDSTPLADLAQECGAVAAVPSSDPHALVEETLRRLRDERLCREEGGAGKRFVVKRRRKDEQVRQLLSLLIGAEADDVS